MNSESESNDNNEVNATSPVTPTEPTAEEEANEESDNNDNSEPLSYCDTPMKAAVVMAFMTLTKIQVSSLCWNYR